MLIFVSLFLSLGRAQPAPPAPTPIPLAKPTAKPIPQRKPKPLVALPNYDEETSTRLQIFLDNTDIEDLILRRGGENIATVR